MPFTNRGEEKPAPRLNLEEGEEAFPRLLIIWTAAPCVAVRSQGQDFVLPLLGLLLWQGMTLVSCREQHQIAIPGKRRDLRDTTARLHQAVEAGRRAESPGHGAEATEKREPDLR